MLNKIELDTRRIEQLSSLSGTHTLNFFQISLLMSILAII